MVRRRVSGAGCDSRASEGTQSGAVWTKEGSTESGRSSRHDDVNVQSRIEVVSRIAECRVNLPVRLNHGTATDGTGIPRPRGGRAEDSNRARPVRVLAGRDVSVPVSGYHRPSIRNVNFETQFRDDACRVRTARTILSGFPGKRLAFAARPLNRGPRRFIRNSPGALLKSRMDIV